MRLAPALFRLLVLLGLTALLAACAPRPTLEADRRNPDLIPLLERRLAADPNDPEAVRELGILYLQERRLGEAAPLLDRARRLSPDRPDVRFYHALLLELTGRPDDALQAYTAYTELPRGDRYRAWMQTRYAALVRTQIRREVAAYRAGERNLAPGTDRTVAVLPLRFAGGDSRYAPLGRGLSALIVNDLAQVDALTLVERLRLNAVLDELALSEQGLTDPSTAPRVGRLLGAGHLVGGLYLVPGDETVRLDLALQRVETAGPAALVSATETLRRLFDLQKTLVFQLIDELGLEITPVERERIERVPTENLLALLAFSRGLTDEDAGRYTAAAGHYREALRLDPAFATAAEHLTYSEQAAEIAAFRPDLFREGEEHDLVRERLGHLGTNLGALALPGPDGRKPATEGRDPIGVVLGAPPDPPTPSGQR